jgi:hypothetical protein
VLSSRGVNRIRLGEWIARSLAWGLAAMVTCCAQVSERAKQHDAASEAGQGSSGASGGSASLGGTGLELGGSVPVDDHGGSTSVAGAVTAVPLLDTTLCGHDFARVDQVPDTALFFSGTFDGEPVDVSESADVSEAPTFYVFRFGATHVEAISFSLYLAEAPYSGFLQVSAVDCGTYGSLLHREVAGPHYYELASAELVTATHSVDGFSGLTTGSIYASWIDDGGEQHVLDANFAVNAVMGDARTQR